jgi:hypothetical protein
VSIEKKTPVSTAWRSSRRGGSSRSGRQLISTAVPDSAHAAKTASASNSDSGRLERSLPVQCPSTSTSGLRTAAIIRRVISALGILSLECTDATTTSSPASSPSSWSSDPSRRMSHSIPVNSQKGATSSLTSATTSSCARSRSGESPRATVSRGEWSVSTA